MTDTTKVQDPAAVSVTDEMDAARARGALRPKATDDIHRRRRRPHPGGRALRLHGDSAAGRGCPADIDRGLAQQLLPDARQPRPDRADPDRAGGLRGSGRASSRADRIRPTSGTRLLLAAPHRVLRHPGSRVHAAAALPGRAHLCPRDRRHPRRRALLCRLPGQSRSRLPLPARPLHGAGNDPAAGRTGLPRDLDVHPVVLRQDRRRRSSDGTTTSGPSPIPRASGRSSTRIIWVLFVPTVATILGLAARGVHRQGAGREGPQDPDLHDLRASRSSVRASSGSSSTTTVRASRSASSTRSSSPSAGSPCRGSRGRRS